MREASLCGIRLPLIPLGVGADVIFVDWVAEAREFQNASLWVVVEVVDDWCEGMVR